MLFLCTVGNRNHTVVCKGRVLLDFMKYIIIILTVVIDSERQRASHMPLVPAIAGRSRNAGIKKMNPRSAASMVAGLTCSTL